MKKKQAMKAIAAAGVAIGGAHVFSDGNMVYAAELNEEVENPEEVIWDSEEKEEQPEEEISEEPAR